MENKELMPFKKYVQAYLNKNYHEDTKWIKGTFKEIPSNKIIDRDLFEAHLVGKRDIKETYKAYLSWFNHTRTSTEPERKFVSVKLVDNIPEDDK